MGECPAAVRIPAGFSGICGKKVEGRDWAGCENRNAAGASGRRRWFASRSGSCGGRGWGWPGRTGAAVPSPAGREPAGGGGVCRETGGMEGDEFRGDFVVAPFNERVSAIKKAIVICLGQLPAKIGRSIATFAKCVHLRQNRGAIDLFVSAGEAFFPIKLNGYRWKIMRQRQSASTPCE